MEFYTPDAAQLTLSSLIQTFGTWVLVPYLSIAFGGALVGVCYDSCGRLKNDNDSVALASKVIRLVTGNFGVGFLLAVVPAIAVGFCYTQFTYGTNSSAAQYMFWGAFFNLVGLLFLNKYRESFEFKENAKDENHNNIADEYEAARNYAGLASVFFLFIGSFFVIGGIAVVQDTSLWQHGFIVVFTSIQVWLKYCAFFCGALGFVGMGILFYLYAWEGGIGEASEKVKEKANLVGATLALFFIPFFTVFIGLHMKFIPTMSYSLLVILFAALAVASLFVVLHMVYYSFVHKDKRAAFAGFVLFLVSFLFVILTDNFSRKGALREHIHQFTQSSGDHGDHGDHDH